MPDRSLLSTLSVLVAAATARPERLFLNLGFAIRRRYRRRADRHRGTFSTPVARAGETHASFPSSTAGHPSTAGNQALPATRAGRSGCCPLSLLGAGSRAVRRDLRERALFDQHRPGIGLLHSSILQCVRRYQTAGAPKRRRFTRYHWHALLKLLFAARVSAKPTRYPP